jgi:hypothetical protein
MPGRLVALAAVLIGLAFPGTAWAHFQSGFYSHDNSGCASRVDPITVVFYGYATASRTSNHIKFHTGWGGGSGGNQYFASHGECGGTTYQDYSACGTCTRYHVRMRQTYDDDATFGTTTTGTPHHEDWTYCGHAVDKGGVNLGGGGQSGFDQGRSRIYTALASASGHGYGGDSNWGNTQEFQQCDHDWAGSHGSVFWFRIPNTSH